MHVPSNPVPRSPRPPFAAAVIAMFAGVVGIAHAVEFDEKVKAPRARSAEQLRLVASMTSQEFMDASLDTREALIRDPSRARRRFDARWTMVHAVETRTPLGDLAEYGIVPDENGEVRIDLAKFPQWDDFESGMVSMLTRLQIDALAEQLTNRGMTAEDVESLRSYVANHDAAAARRGTLPITLGFGKLVRKYDKVKRPVPNDLVFDFYYQKSAATAEADRVWLAGLLAALDAHAGRILLSFFGELPGIAIWAPSDLNAAARDTLSKARLPDFEQRALAEAMGGAK